MLNMKRENNLFYYRKIFNLTQTDLSKICGLSKNTISAIENGSGLTLDHAIMIAERLKVRFDYIFPEINCYAINYRHSEDFRSGMFYQYLDENPDEKAAYIKELRESVTKLGDDEEPPF